MTGGLPDRSPRLLRHPRPSASGPCHNLVTAGPEKRADCVAQQKIVNCVSSWDSTIFGSVAAGDVREHYLDMVGVTGSIPVVPTTQSSET
jgi:hypothetical protein